MLITTFGSKRDMLGDWKIVNDSVMGGLSKGYFEMIADSKMMKFHGEISTENNGGFSYLKSEEKEMDLSKYDGIKLRVRGDGRTYTVDFQCDEQYDSKWGKYAVSFIHTFETEKDKWTEVSIPFDELEGNFWGQPLADRTFNKSKFNRFGLYLFDKADGPFDIKIDWIKAY